jgi:hypothetical protein
MRRARSWGLLLCLAAGCSAGAVTDGPDAGLRAPRAQAPDAATPVDPEIAPAPQTEPPPAPRTDLEPTTEPAPETEPVPDAGPPVDARAADGAADGVDGGRPAWPPLPSFPAVIPVVRLEVAGQVINPDRPVIGRFELVEEHDGTPPDMTTRAPALRTRVAITTRGNSSRGFPKKSYGLELRDDVDTARAIDRSLLGMPAESDWVLYACYLDKTCLRNALVYDLGQQLGRWTPRARFVEVFVDRQYNGLYMLVEKIKRGKARVPIPRPAASATAGDLTGGYIFRREGEGKGGARDWISVTGTKWSYRHPNAEEITAEQKRYLQDYVNAFSRLLASPDWNHPTEGYRTWIDLPSWIDVGLVQELTNNRDAYWKSWHLWKAPGAAGGALHMGPLWDFDIAFGNVNYGDGEKTNVLVHAVSPWKIVWTDPAFRDGARCRWQALRAGPWSTAALDARLDATVRHIAAAVARDQARWKTIGAAIGRYAYIGPTYDAEVKYLRDWLRRRVAWLDEGLPGRCDRAP